MTRNVLRQVSVTLLLALALPAYPSAQTSTFADDFSITLKRVGCLGTCPDYEVTIHGNGKVRYQGNFYVRVDGVHESTISKDDVQKLVKELQEEHFFQWPENDKACLDFPEVHITARLGDQQKHVLEGCNEPGKILTLADQIDRISGDKRWVDG